MEPEAEQEKLQQDRWYWGWFAIFGLLAGFTPFVPSSFAIPCGIIGFGGLLIQMREGFRTRFARIRQARISRAQLLALMRIAAVVMLTILGIKTVSLVFEIKNTFDTYVMPRTLTREQGATIKTLISSYDLRSYDPHATILVVASVADSEGLEYGSQLNNAIIDGGWGANFYGVNPWDPDSTDNLQVFGKAFHNMSLVLDTGVLIRVGYVGIPQTPDPQHPSPDIVLAKAFRSAGIEVSIQPGQRNSDQYRLIVEVARRRPLVRPTLREKLAQWLEEWR